MREENASDVLGCNTGTEANGTSEGYFLVGLYAILTGAIYLFCMLSLVLALLIYLIFFVSKNYCKCCKHLLCCIILPAFIFFLIIDIIVEVAELFTAFASQIFDDCDNFNGALFTFLNSVVFAMNLVTLVQFCFIVIVAFKAYTGDTEKIIT